MFLPNGSSRDDTPVRIGLGGTDSANGFWRFEPGESSFFVNEVVFSYFFVKVVSWNVGEKNMRGVPGAPEEKA
jgi:hypothetical protein